MKKILAYSFITAILIVAFNIRALAQKQESPVFNHFALYIFDLTKSTDFYKNVVQLNVIPEPFHDGRHTWLKVGAGSALHLIQGAKEVTQHDMNTHLCFSVSSVEKFVAHLDQKNIPYTNAQGVAKSVTTRVDGVKQIYFQDPDNYWIEINDDKK
jgi:lactoylglutathione lyase